jgi:hypothetical protein
VLLIVGRLTGAGRAGPVGGGLSPRFAAGSLGWPLMVRETDGARQCGAVDRLRVRSGPESALAGPESGPRNGLLRGSGRPVRIAVPQADRSHGIFLPRKRIGARSPSLCPGCLGRMDRSVGTRGRVVGGVVVGAAKTLQISVRPTLDTPKRFGSLSGSPETWGDGGGMGGIHSLYWLYPLTPAGKAYILAGYRRKCYVPMQKRSLTSDVSE